MKFRVKSLSNISMAEPKRRYLVPGYINTAGNFQNVDLTTIVSKQRLTFKSEKSATYLDNATPYCWNPKDV